MYASTQSSGVFMLRWIRCLISPSGEFSNGITPRGKPGPDAPRGTRQGINDYTKWFASDKDMAGNYFGYDGPCPPWNDTIPHHYVFTLYALPSPSGVTAEMPGQQAIDLLSDGATATAKLRGEYETPS